MANPASGAHAAWSGNPSISNTSLPGKEALLDGGIANADIKNEQDQRKDRTEPTTQELASFVVQCRSST